MIPACWQLHDAERVLSADAGNDADMPGVFAATHRPVAGVRHQVGTADEKLADVTGNALLGLAGDVPHDDPIIIPVLGQPGTGKSHLVRWAWTQFHDSRSDGFCIVYVPRARMSMAGVVERLLSAAREDKDPAVAEAATKLIDAARDTFEGRDREWVARELCNEVSRQLRRASETRKEQGRSSEADDVLSRLLADLVVDGGELSERLEREDSAVGRRVTLLMQGASSGDDLVSAHGFIAQELEELNEISAAQTRRFKNALRRILHDREFGDLSHAADLLNEALDLAVTDLLERTGGSGGLSFSKVFRQLRESLHEAGRELVVFVEELKVLGGIERPLLETFLDNRAAIGEKPICRVRAMLACTKGEWDRLSGDIGTLQSRLEAWGAPRYDLDAGQATDKEVAFSRAEIVDRVREMAAFYLNATRCGVGEIEESFAGRSGAEWRPPNACTPCEFRADCHAAFGSVPDDSGLPIGLFPFNVDELERAQETVQRARGHDGLASGMNARVLITSVLRPTLELWPIDGASPENLREIALRLEAPAAVVNELESQARTAHGVPADNAQNLAGAAWIWGSSSVDPDDRNATLWIVSPEITAQAGIQPVPPMKTRNTSSGEPRKPDPDREPEPSNTLLEAATAWVNGTQLIQDDTRELRNRIYELALQRLDWQGIAGTGPTPRLLREMGLASAENSIRIERSRTSARPRGSAGADLTFTPTDDGRFVVGVAALARQANRLRFVGDVPSFVEVAEGIHIVAESIVSTAHARGIGRGLPLSAEHPAIAGLAAASGSLGLDDGVIGDGPSLLSAMLEVTPGVEKVAKDATPDMIKLQQYVREGEPARAGDAVYETKEKVDREALRQWLLTRLGFRRGLAPRETDAVQMIDGAAIFDAVASLSNRSALIEAGTATTESVSDAQHRFARNTLALVHKAVAAEKDAIVKWMKLAGPHLGVQPSEHNVKPWLEALEAAVDRADNVRRAVFDGGLVPAGTAFNQFSTATELLSRWLDEADRHDVIADTVQVATIGKTPDRAQLHALGRDYPDIVMLRALSKNFVIKADVAYEQIVDHIGFLLAGTATSPVIDQFPDQYRSALERSEVAARSVAS